MMVDQFTMCFDFVPLPSQNAEAITAIKKFFSRFGSPLQLFFDQERNVESQLFEAWRDAL